MATDHKTGKVRLTPGVRPQDEFEALFARHFHSIWVYVARRVSPAHVDDVVSKCFSVAWQRFERVPQPPKDRLWMYGVARRCIADQRRSDMRHLRLVNRVSSDMAQHLTRGNDFSDPRSILVLEAIERLAPADREALQLVLWDGLSQSDAAEIMKCSVAAFESKYRRARNAVKSFVDSAYLESSSSDSGVQFKGERP